MVNPKRTTGIYLGSVLILTMVAVALRTVAVIKYLDVTTGYFSKNIFITVADAVAVCAVLIGASYLLFGNKELRLIPAFEGGRSYVPSAAVMLSLLFLAMDLFAKYQTDVGSAFSIIKPIAGALALISIVGFFFSLLSTSGKDERLGWFGIATVAFFVLYSAHLYFDTALPLNSAVKSADRMAYLAAAAFFLFETRISLCRDKWWAYVSFGMIGATTTAYSAVPSLIMYFAKGQIISNSLYESILTLALFAFITLRVVMSLYFREDAESDFVKFIKETEALRETAEKHEHTDTTKDAENYSMDIQGIEDEK